MLPIDKLSQIQPPLVAASIAFAFCAAAYPFYIKWLSSKQIGQFIREEGPASHAVKAKTPTMGGLCFIAGTVLATLAVTLLLPHGGDGLLPGTANGVAGLTGGAAGSGIAAGSGAAGSSAAGSSAAALSLIYTAADENKRAFIVLVAAILCGLLGLADDYGKITSKSNTGISGKFRLLCEFALGFGLAIGFYIILPPQSSVHIALGMGGCFAGVHLFDLSQHPFLDPLYRYMLVPFIMAATSNALNLHDGMDGLAGGTSFFVFATLAAMLICIPGCTALGWTAAAAAGAMLGYLLYNKYPARIFMGDTGSLFIGALMAGLVVYGGLVLWFIPMSVIYILEAISVMAQVVYFKLTKPYTPEKPMSTLSLALFKLRHKLPGQGKRLLRMAPMHHHFEAVASDHGRKEWEVVLWFILAQLVLCAICLAAFAFAA